MLARVAPAITYSTAVIPVLTNGESDVARTLFVRHAKDVVATIFFSSKDIFVAFNSCILFYRGYSKSSAYIDNGSVEAGDGQSSVPVN